MDGRLSMNSNADANAFTFQPEAMASRERLRRTLSSSSTMHTVQQLLSMSFLGELCSWKVCVRLPGIGFDGRQTVSGTGRSGQTT
jgi:hypothetical protein